MTDDDRALLYFLAEHRLVLERQIAKLCGTRAGDRALRSRLRRLAKERCVQRDEVFGERHYQIRKLGLLAIGSELPVPRPSLGAYRHDIGVAWLWLAAHGGVFGPLREVIGERRLRSHDRALEHPEDPYGVRLGGLDRDGREALHYPDLLLIDRGGRRVALELELSPKGTRRRESIIGAYGTDRRIDRVLYLLESTPSGRAIGRATQRIVGEMGLSDRIRFHLIRELRIGRADAETRPRAVAGRRAADTTR